MTDGLRAHLVALLPRLRRFARGLAGSVAEADDLVQASCERALAGQSTWRPGSRLDSWMFGICQDLWIDGRRAVTIRGPHLGTDADPAAELAGAARDEHGARSALEAVRRALCRLPDDQRVILLLACVEGQTYRECAEMLDIPVGTVMSRLARARLALCRLVEDPGERRDPPERRAVR